MERPIVILGMPRSGTSMVAGVFSEHGVWSGRCILANKINAKGYFENLDFKNLNIKYSGRLAQSGVLAKPVKGFADKVKSFVPESGPWMAKFSAMYYPLWVDLDPFWICIRRKSEGIACSNLKTGYFGTKNLDEIYTLIRRHNEAMNQVPGVDVYADDLIKGYDWSIKRAIEHCGLKYDPKMTRDFIDPNLWHYKCA